MRFVFYSVLILVTLTLLAGVTTFLYSESQGEITAVSKSVVRGAAYPSASGHDGGEKTILNVKYEYFVGNQNYSSSIVAFWFITSPKESYLIGQKVKVFYVPFYPKIAVLKKGPDIWLLLSAIAALVGWLLLKSTLQKRLEDV